MADDDEDIAALVVDNGSGMCKGEFIWFETSGWKEVSVDSDCIRRVASNIRTL